MIVNVDGQIYAVDDKLATNIINAAKERFNGKNAIVAIEKKGLIEMRRDEFPNVKKLNETVKIYNDNGFYVHCIRKYGEN